MIEDPLGLLDRDLRDYNTRYDTFVSNADEVIRITNDWYHTFREEKGEPGEAANTDRHHGYYRMIDEYPRWHTMRRAYQEAWPLASSGGGGGHQPGTTERLHVQGHYFVKEGGTRHTVIGISSFVLQKFSCEGTGLEPWLSQVRDIGFNTVRDFAAQEWGDPRYDVLPTTHENYYLHLQDTAQVCADHGLYYMACLFAGWQPSRETQLDHFNRSIEALRPYPNVLIELVNENDASGELDTSIFSQPTGVLASHGSNGSQQLAVRPPWDWEAFHTNGAAEEQRKVGHNAMEMNTGTNKPDGTVDWPASGKPIITNETSRYPEVGMWRDRTQQDREMLAFDSAAGAALLCAGSFYHSVNAKLCLALPPEEEAIARAWVNGALSVPLEFQDGRYRRDDNLAPNELRKYARVLGDGRAHWVTIHR